jgi:hypothetical protein
MTVEMRENRPKETDSMHQLLLLFSRIVLVHVTKLLHCFSCSFSQDNIFGKQFTPPTPSRDEIVSLYPPDFRCSDLTLGDDC